jgi:hypothetical protein
MKERPEGMTEEHFDYLDELRESGRTNMFGAAQYLENEMDVPRMDAKKFLAHWMETFSERTIDTESAGAEEDDYAESEKDRKENEHE